MANLEITWKIIKENQFQLINPLNEGLVCLICNRIMINATNAPCGCRYCCQCIKEHLNGTDNNNCPGSNKYCRNNLIDFDRDICIDRSINIRISQLTVKCPIETCEFTDELSMMEEHLNGCDKKLMSCPYSEIGCCKPEVRQGEVIKHLSIESFSHNKLLVEYVNNLRNEIEELKGKMSTMKTENVCLVENLEKREDNIKLEQLKLKDEINALIKENKVKDIQIKTLNHKVETLVEDRKEDPISKRIKQLEDKHEKIEANVSLLPKTSKVSMNWFEKMEGKVSKLKVSVVDLVAFKYLFLQKFILVTDQLENKKFIWKIENLSKVIEDAKEKSNTKVFSDPFFVNENGYQMCLCVCPNGLVKTKGFFGVYFSIMKGPYDDILSWPCKINVILEIINQDDGSAFRSKMEIYESDPKDEVYDKPTSKRNASFGFPYFIKLNDLLKQKELIRNDQLFIKCKVCLTE